MFCYQNYIFYKNGKVYNTKLKRFIKGKYITIVNENQRKERITIKSLFKRLNKIYCVDDIQSLKDEEWIIMYDIDDRYLISNYGEIKSYCRYEAKILDQEMRKGYLRIKIKDKHYTTHKLVAKYFLNPIDDCRFPKDYDVHHKDLNRLNNYYKNLQYLTKEEHRKIHQEARRK